MRRTREERASAAESKALWARADAEAAKREEVSVLLRCVKGADKLIDGASDSDKAPLLAARDGCAASLKAMGVPVPD